MDATVTVPPLIGAELRGGCGARAGRIVDLALDARRRPTWLVVRLTGTDGACTLVPHAPLRHHDGTFVTRPSAELIRASPVRGTTPRLPGPDELLRLRGHFGTMAAGEVAAFLRAGVPLLAPRPLAVAS